MNVVLPLKVQIAMDNARYRAALCRLLAASAPCDILCVEDPDLATDGVLVLDGRHLERLEEPIASGDRIVLITQPEPGDNAASLSRAWQAGVHSVVYDRDPLSTAVLAILSIRLRSAKAQPGRWKGSV